MLLSLSHVLFKIFNITHHEWLRVVYSFSVKMLFRIIYVVSTTILLASFLDEFHIESLPLYYVIISIAVIAGSFVFGFFIDSIERKRFVIWLLIGSIFIVSGAGLAGDRSLAFFALLFIFVSVFLRQADIALSLFVEELFSPLEAERTLPIIEASEPFGGIIAGIILAVGATAFHVEDFFIMLFLLMIGLMSFLVFSVFLYKVPRLVSKEEIEEMRSSKVAKMLKGFRHVKGMKYLRLLGFVVMLYFVLFMLIEYQYTSALDASIMESLEHGDGHAADHSYAGMLAHGLGFWHILFSGLLFLSQIFAVSRVIRFFGIVRAMAIQPLLMLIPGVGLLSFFSLASAVTAKASFEVLGGIQRTAYHSSFYALKSSIRNYSKEFLEGIARPVGLLIGTALIFLSSLVFHGSQMNLVISVLTLLLCLAMYQLTTKMKDEYTRSAKKNLQQDGNSENKLLAIEVLTQKGHSGSEFILGEMLSSNELPEFKGKVLKSLSLIGSYYSIPDILRCIKDESSIVQNSAIRALAGYRDIGKELSTQGFAKYRIINELEDLMFNSDSLRAKSLSMKVFTHIDHPDIVSFLLKTLENADDKVIADIIYLCKEFDDINVAHFIEKYLDSENAWIKASAIIALWQFPNYRTRLVVMISTMLSSNDKQTKLAGIYVAGEVGAYHEIDNIVKFLEEEDDIRREAAIALLKMDNFEAVNDILDLILNKEKSYSMKTKKWISESSRVVSDHVRNLLVNEVAKKIRKIIEDNNTNVLEDLDKDNLEDLMHYYGLIDEDAEVIRIKYILRSR